MKNLILVVLLCLPLALAADETNTIDSTKPAVHHPTQGQLEIVKVFREHATAKMLNARLVIDYGRLTALIPHWPQYTAAIHKIDADKCPRVFNLAWFDYKASLDKAGRPFAGEGQNILKSKTIMQFGANILLSRVAESEEIAEAWTKLERSALECGVDAEKIKY